MIKTLSYQVTFPTTGRTLAGNFSFEKGLTAIVGANESGKSLSIEMMKFCLFGVSALRGKREDYDKLSATLELDLKGSPYRIERTLANAKILSGETPLAVGTTPVNKKILSILGFDLNVFDMACNSNQSEITRLGDVPATERKRLVDQTIGLDRLDDIQKWAAEQRLLLGREIEVLAKGIATEPTKPEVPFNYEPSANLEAKLKELRAAKSEFDQLIGWLAHEKTAPAEPAAPETTATDDELVQIDETNAKRRHIEMLPVVDFDIEAARAAWVAYDAYQAFLKYRDAHPFPTMTREQVDAERARAKTIRDLEELEAQHARTMRSPEVTCPECGSHFHLEHEKMAQIADQIVAINGVDRTPVDLAKLDKEERRLRDWASPETEAEWRRLKDTPEAVQPDISRTQLSVSANSITSAERARQLSELPKLRDRMVVIKELDAQRQYKARLELFERERLAFQTWLAERAVKRDKAEELAPIVGALPGVEKLLQEALTYERDRASYETQLESFKEKVAEVEAKKVEYDGWKNVVAFLNEIRLRIKTYLVPSLSRVASHLLTQMTGGERSSIEVNENFDILVDGQRLDTLSGSGKACANLALRIGLGQVLTNNVLSIFIGDEIDASMDQNRADFTQNSLGSLTNQISQIFLVTHKIPSADHVVRLEG